jgi:hypothetical protein
LTSVRPGQWKIFKAGVCDVEITLDEKTGDLVCGDAFGRRITLFDWAELKEFVCSNRTGS